MKTQCTWLLALATSFLLATGPALAQAPAPVQNAGYLQQGYLPLSVSQSMIQQAGFAACQNCGGAGCQACTGGCGPAGCPGDPMATHRYGGYSTMLLGEQNGPLGGGGCCTPIWHDFHIEAMHLRRDGVGNNIDITSLDPGGPIVLSTDDLDLEDAIGFRATYAYLIAPATNLELTYFGTHSWDDTQTVTGNGNLWSVFSNFGGDPPQGGILGFPQTVDAADLHSISYSSELNNAELNLRRRWVSANCLLHGSYLGGVRYTSLHETFSHNTQVASGGFMNYDVETENDMVGFQVGSELYVCVSPRFKLGAEIEAGLFGNDAKYAGSVNTREVVDAVAVDANPVNEFTDKNDVAFLSEASAIGLFRVTPRLTIRGGYTLLFMDGMALATENFNATSSPFAAAGRSVSIRNQGEVFYHGANLGITWTW